MYNNEYNVEWSHDALLKHCLTAFGHNMTQRLSRDQTIILKQLRYVNNVLWRHDAMFQHYLTAFGSTITVPLVLAPALCMDEDTVGLSELISTIFFVSGVSTIIQTTIGVR